ncbi:hypothetical protein J8I26_16115 [Herbaspirillum sp. LeCh32-8]|uniref:hypothetical protein n=1 Tax=Herbaspirillum sp. LeCh32-8 TaxID=2821356 RepID=UPI001AE6AC55|nr:hypothetical protein [Herbaspirillum sp. LeCh32-8]MBP0599641.1 hypothetical protein [Herbaspirillum sp. LeCh32-8]
MRRGLRALPLLASLAFLDAASAATLQQDLMTRAVVLRGDIDGRTIQLSLQPKRNEDGLEGRYFFFGGSPEILVAGEVEGDDLVMEESVNGKDVSGQWEGHRQGNAIIGTWSNADGSVTKPFSLQMP